jgi:hypothetical protein
MICLLVSAFGCATRYHEPPGADTQTATLEAIAPVWVVSIDHAKVSRVSLSGHKQFRILPGTHVIEVEYSFHERDFNDGSDIHVSSKQAQLLNFVAAPGKTYYIKSGRTAYRWKPFVTDSLQPVFTNPN